MKRIACIHTVYSVISEFTAQLRAALPEDVKIHTLYDDFLVTDPSETGKFSSVNHERLRNDMHTCALTGADAIVVSCSTLSPSVRLLRGEFNIPVVAVDDAMMQAAVAAGSHIGLLATATSTVKPSTSALLAAAEAAGKHVELQVLCNKDAIAALNAGDRETHDKLVLEMADKLSGCDAIVLAQASMAHMEQAVAEQTGLPTFTSPSRCVEQVRRILEGI